MALSEADKKEMQETMARGIADGLKLFRSEAEEEAAKANAGKEEPKQKSEGGKDDNDDGGFSLPGFLLGKR